MDKVISVTGLNYYVKSLLEEDINLADIAVEGEISNFVNHYKSGHYYLALKDDKSLIKTVMFSAYNKKLTFYGKKDNLNLNTIMYYQDAVINELKELKIISEDTIKQEIGRAHV